MVRHSPTNCSTQEWLVPPDVLTLREGEVHVWRGIVDIPFSCLQVYRDALNSDEQQRARRLRFPRHQRRFIAARGMLRFLLGHYLNRSPHDIELDAGPHGKPFVQNNEGGRTFYFNVSHSQRIALFAFSRDSEVGIDVEGPRPRLDYQAVAKRVLNSQEQQWLQNLPSQKQKSAFLTCWTRKEAFAKAHGVGLMFPFRDITVTFQPSQPASIVKIEDPWLNSRRWALYPLYPRTPYAGALVVAGQPHSIKYWDYQEWKH